ncbi:hypothetical protein KAJ27_03830 [bacterium]|nr:hypothetical protein [bacterium]
MNKDKWKGLVGILIITGILLMLLYVATSSEKITNNAKVMMVVLVFFTVTILYVVNRLMETYFHPTVKKYITFFCWAVFLITATIMYSFLGLIAEVNSQNHSLDHFVFNGVYYKNPVKVEFTKKYQKFLKDGGEKNPDVLMFNKLISLDASWLDDLLSDKRCVLQREIVKPSEQLFGVATTLTEIRAFSLVLLTKIHGEENLEQRFEACKKLLVYSQVCTRYGLYGTNTTLIEALVGFSIEKRTILAILKFIEEQPEFWNEKKMNEMGEFLVKLKKYRLTPSEVYDGEHRFISSSLHYLYVKHTYAMFWLDSYFGSASIQYNKVMNRYLTALQNDKEISIAEWKQIRSKLTNPLVGISMPNIRVIGKTFKKTDVFYNSILWKLTGVPQSDPFVPGKKILKITIGDAEKMYSRGTNKIDEGRMGDDIVVE